VRIGLGPIALAHATRAHLEAMAHAAVAASFDSIWVAESRADAVGGGVAAAALLAQLAPIRVGAVIDVGADHPLYLAEDMAVADLASRGRLEVVLRGGLEEQLEVLVRALGGAHLQFDGQSLRVPARLDANQPAPQRLALNPAPAQPAIPMWLEGASPALAMRLGVGLASTWRQSAAIPPESGRWPGMLLCPNGVLADDLLAAAGRSSAYFLVAADTASEAASAGRRLVGPLRMPEFPAWINQQ
jgi:alkanesulfonate monooxygenase SsuD/methylene tetrahydromethanopterin reductase-like flavin-dependent oxidoreductase (luciferase family)